MYGTLKWGHHKFAVACNASFGAVKMLLKPIDLASAMFAEGITPEGIPDTLQESLEEDFTLAMYRLDVLSGAKASTTLGNKDFASAVLVMYSAFVKLAHSQRTVNAGGDYSPEWVEQISDPEFTGVYCSLDGLVSSVAFKTNMPATGEVFELVLLGDNTNIPNVSELITSTLGLEESDNGTLFGSLYMNVRSLQSTVASRPYFTAVKKAGEGLYTLTKAYAEVWEPFKELLPKRTGYFSVSVYKDCSYPGVQHLRSGITKDTASIGVYQTIEDVREAHPHKNTEWINYCNYVIVDDASLDSVMKELWEYDIIAFDTETTGLDITFRSRDGEGSEIVGVGLSGKVGTGYYFPLQHKLFPNLCGGDHRYFMETYMKDFLETKSIVEHNNSFDWKVAYIYGINVNCVFDTILAFGVTKRYEFVDFQLALSALCKNIFSLDMFDIADFMMGDWADMDTTFADLPYDLVRAYGPADADITLRLYYHCLETGLLENYSANRVFELEVNFSKVVAYSEFYGIHFDIKNLPALEENVLNGMAKHENRLFKLAGREFNPNSSVQVCKILYDELHPELLASKIVYKRSSAKDILWDLASYETDTGAPLYPFASELLKYRSFETVYKNFLKKKHEHITPDGFVFAGVKQLGTNTGRVSISSPNYQSYNDTVKKYVTGRPGFYMYDCDFAQVEYRVLASMAGQDQLMEAFKDPDLDYHTHQAARMFSLPYASVSPALRQQSKGVNFGLPYGMGDSSLGKRVFGAETPENTAKAAGLRRKFFEGQEKIEAFFERVRAQGVNSGYTETWLGRRRYYHRSVFSVGAIRRQAGNHVIQGTAADIWKLAVVRFFNRVVKEGLLGKVLFNCFVHDELLGEVSVDVNPYDFIKMWRDEYEIVLDKFCPLFAGFGWGRSWYEAKKADYPPYFIDSLVAKIDEDIPWDGDYEALIDDTLKAKYDYEAQRVTDWLVALEGETILAPHIGTYLYAKTADWRLAELRSRDTEFDDFCKEYLNEHQRAKMSEIVGVRGEMLGYFPSKPDLEQTLEYFCSHVGIPYTKGLVVPPDAVVSSVSDEVDEDNDSEMVASKAQLIAQHTFDFGFHLDTEKMVLYLKYKDQASLDSVTSTLGCTQEDGGIIGLVVLAFDNQGIPTAYAINTYFKFESFNILQETLRIMYS